MNVLAAAALSYGSDQGPKLREHHITSEDSSAVKDVGGWSGWFELSSKKNATCKEPEVPAESDIDDKKSNENLDFEENLDTKEIPPADDVGVLLKKPGIDIDAKPNSDVKDAKTWNIWSKEELLRDNEQWMPVRENAGSDTIMSEFLVCSLVLGLGNSESRLISPQSGFETSLALGWSRSLSFFLPMLALRMMISTWIGKEERKIYEV
ncbi:hypothetical protein Cni_G19931 [Canna indica]|uniref:Uncharacterized protein n=1 Tax=Canna indica TaxID=4628 RepID=A0AAQ3KM98_9LILI|nr:hypothetical protein Cni_G19931 [Canna indica]